MKLELPVSIVATSFITTFLKRGSFCWRLKKYFTY